MPVVANDANDYGAGKKKAAQMDRQEPREGDSRGIYQQASFEPIL